MPKQDPRKAKAKKRSNQGLWWVIGTAVVAAGALIGFVLMSTNKQPEPTTPPVAVTNTDAALQAERNTMGPKTAKVEVVEYGDYL